MNQRSDRPACRRNDLASRSRGGRHAVRSVPGTTCRASARAVVRRRLVPVLRDVQSAVLGQRSSVGGSRPAVLGRRLSAAVPRHDGHCPAVPAGHAPFGAGDERTQLARRSETYACRLDTDRECARRLVGGSRSSTVADGAASRAGNIASRFSGLGGPTPIEFTRGIASRVRGARPSSAGQRTRTSSISSRFSELGPRRRNSLPARTSSCHGSAELNRWRDSDGHRPESVLGSTPSRAEETTWLF